MTTQHLSVPGGRPVRASPNVATLKADKLVLDWKKKLDARAGVWVAVEDYHDKLPESPYPIEVYGSKCGAGYQHVYSANQDAEYSVYAWRFNWGTRGGWIANVASMT